MADLRAQYTEEAVGANHPTKADVVNRLALAALNNDGRLLLKGARVHKNGTNQTIATGTATKLTWSTVDFDPLIWFNDANERIIPTLAGKVRVNATARFLSANDGVRLDMEIRKNGGNVGFSRNPVGASGSANVAAAAEIDVNGSTDYIEIYVDHDHGSNLDISGGIADTYFEVVFTGGE